jgi:hypothetical protein
MGGEGEVLLDGRATLRSACGAAAPPTTPPATGDAAFVMPNDPAWTQAPPGSNWIGYIPTAYVNGDGHSAIAGFCTYFMHFQVTDPSSASLSGVFSSDNNSRLFLNDTQLSAALSLGIDRRERAHQSARSGSDPESGVDRDQIR